MAPASKNGPRYNSQKRPTDLRNENKIEKPRRGSQQGIRPPLPKAGNNKNKENQKDANGGETRKGYGKVPKYLQRFNKEKEEQKIQKELDDEMAKCPPGTRKMPEGERQDMLVELKETKAKLEAEIQKFPLSMKTMAIQKRKQEMEDQLGKVENSIKLFSRETVYVGI